MEASRWASRVGWDGQSGAISLRSRPPTRPGGGTTGSASSWGSSSPATPGLLLEDRPLLRGEDPAKPFIHLSLKLIELPGLIGSEIELVAHGHRDDLPRPAPARPATVGSSPAIRRTTASLRASTVRWRTAAIRRAS